MQVSAATNAVNQFSAAQVGDGNQSPAVKKVAEDQVKAAVVQVNETPKPANLPSHLGQNINTTA